MKKIRVGVVGLGFIGTVHVEQLRRLGNVDVVAITEVDSPQQKADAIFVPKGYSGYKEMIDSESLDVVHICTPNNTHFEIAMYAMEQGIHVVCEKPMATSVEEAQEMTRKAKEKGLVNAINFNYRFYPIAKQMKELVASNVLGDIFTITGGYVQDWLLFDTDYNWRLEAGTSGQSRAFADIGSHWVDLVEYVTSSKVVKIIADFEIFNKTRKKPKKAVESFSGMTLKPEDYEEVSIHTEDFASVLFHMDNGAHANCVVSQVFSGKKNQLVLAVSGSKAAIEWDTEDSNDLWIGYRDRENGVYLKDPATLLPQSAKLNAYPGGHVEGFADSIKQNFASIYQAISTNNPASGDFAKFTDGTREMEICSKVIESAEKQAWVKL